MPKPSRTSTRTFFPSVGLLTLCLAWGGIAAAGENLPPRIEWVKCWFEPVWDQELRCAHFFPSRAAAEPAQRLPVVVIKAPAERRRPQPVLYLPGGPGSAAGLDERGMQRWLNWADVARWPHDLVLFDPRGTGLSQPRFDCPEIREQDSKNLAKPLSAAQDLAYFRDAAATCHARLQKQGFRAEDFATPRLVADAAELMQLLGRRDWNLYGVSHGSRLALQLARAHPGRIRSLLLDSAFPPEVNGLLSRPAQFERAWRGMVEACAADADFCGRNRAMFETELNRLFERLRRDPVTVEIEHWPSERVTKLLLNDYRLMWILFLESYRPRYRPRFIHAVSAAATGDFEDWQPLAADYLKDWLDPEHSQPVYLSVTCAEDWPGASEALYRAEVARHPRATAYVDAEWRLSPCQRWPAAPMPSRWREQVTSDIPALFLGGVHDTASLPEWSAQAVRRFSRGHRVAFEGASHAVSWDNPCAMAVAWEFLRDPHDWPLPPCVTAEEKKRAIRPAGAR